MLKNVLGWFGVRLWGRINPGILDNPNRPPPHTPPLPVVPPKGGLLVVSVLTFAQSEDANLLKISDLAPNKWRGG